jgi:hypothetical protein
LEFVGVAEQPGPLEVGSPDADVLRAVEVVFPGEGIVVPHEQSSDYRVPVAAHVQCVDTERGLPIALETGAAVLILVRPAVVLSAVDVQQPLGLGHPHRQPEQELAPGREVGDVVGPFPDVRIDDPAWGGGGKLLIADLRHNIGQVGLARRRSTAVLRDAVADAPAPREAAREKIRHDGTAHGAVQLDQVVVAISARKVGGELLGRLHRAHEDRAGRGVAIQRGLGSAQDLDAVQVVELEQLARRRLHVDAVLVDGDGSCSVGVEVVEAHAPDVDRGIGGGEGGLDLEARREVREIADVADALHQQLIRVKSDDRDGLVLRQHSPRLPGDHDLLHIERRHCTRLEGFGGEIFPGLGAALRLALGLAGGRCRGGLGRSLLLGLREDGGRQQEDRDEDAPGRETSDRRGSARTPCQHSHSSQL